MLLKKSISVILMALQIFMASLAWGAAGWADTSTPNVATTPEARLLESVISLEGQGMPQAGLQLKLTSLLAQYDTTAPIEGRQARLQQSLVTMNILSPEQAQVFTAETQALSEKVQGIHLSSPAEARQVSTVALEQLFQAGLPGAQYSEGCRIGGDLFYGGMGVMVAGLVAIFAVHGFQAFNEDWTSDITIGGFITGVLGWGVAANYCD